MFDSFNLSAIRNQFSNVRRVETSQKLSCALDEMILDEDGKNQIYCILAQDVHNDLILNDLQQMIWFDKAYCGKMSWKDLFEIVCTYKIGVEECFFLVSSNANLSLSQIINIISIKYRNGLANKPFDVVDLESLYTPDEDVIDELEQLLHISFHKDDSTKISVEEFWGFAQTGALDCFCFENNHFINRNKNVSVGEFKSLYQVLRVTSNRSKYFCLSFLLNQVLNSDCESKDIPCIYYSDEYGVKTSKYVIFSLRTWNEKFGMSVRDSSEIRFQNMLNSILYFYYKERSDKSGKAWNERPKKYYSDLYSPIDNEYPDVPSFSCALREKDSNVRILTDKDGCSYLVTSDTDICYVLGYIDKDERPQMDKLWQNIVTRTKGVSYRISDIQTKLSM